MPKAVDKAAAVEAVKKLRKLGIMRNFADAVFAKDKSKRRQRRKS